MLVRTYRLTDKFGVVVLKSAVALGTTTLEGLNLVFGSAQSGTFGALGLILALLGFLLSFLRRIAVAVGAFVLRLLRLVWSVARRIGSLVWSVLRAILGVIGGIVLGVFNLGLRASGQTARSATRMASGTASTTMARRAARAEMKAALKEDPLRVQNRVLSGLVVVILVALIGVVLWATTPRETLPVDMLAAGSFNANALEVTPGATAVSASGAAFSTPVPTATPIPAVLQARGSLAYVVRESGQLDLWAVGVGSNRQPIRITNDPADDRDPAWSPDGRSLAFASRRDGNWDLFIYDLNADVTTRMTFGLEFEGGPQWSPDGQWLVYESYRGESLDIYVMPIDGSQAPMAITDHPAPDFSPAWSPLPDGRRIAFVSWRNGNQDIYIFSLDNGEVTNVTNTPGRDEDYPTWSPDGKYLAYSAVDEGLEKVFVKQVDDPNATAQVMGLGRTPAWSPDGTSIVFAVDSEDSTHMVAVPFTEEAVTTEVIAVALGATHPAWTNVPLPSALVNSGGLGPAITEPLYIEQESPTGGDPPYKLNNLVSVRADPAVLSDRVNDSFNALRETTLQRTGVDFLGQLQDAFWAITRPAESGVERRNWHMTGRQFAFMRSSIQGFPPPVEIVREDLGVNVWWRAYVRVAEDAQDGQLGEPLRRMPWDFLSRSQGDVEAYDQGGRLRSEVPSGYYVDFTQLAADYGWERVPAGSDWRANILSANYWAYRKTGGLDWYAAMREIYTVGEMGGFAPTATPAPVQQPTEGS
jgi:TolB protein